MAKEIVHILFVVASLLHLIPMTHWFSRMVVMAMLMAMTTMAAGANCNNGERVAFDCACVEKEDHCKNEQKDVCSWASGKCSQKPCNEIDDEDKCGVADFRCKWDTAKKCQLVA